MAAAVSLPREERAGWAHEHALVLERGRALRFVEREPTHGVHLPVAVAEAPATASHEKEAHALPDAHHAPPGVAPREPIGDVAQPRLGLGLEPGLLAHLPHPRLLRRLARLDVPLGDGPHEGPALRVAPRGEDHRHRAQAALVDETAGRELALERRPRRLQTSRAVDSASHAR